MDNHSDIGVVVIVGRNRWRLQISPSATFSHLRRLVEEKESTVEHGLRLIFKGTSFPDSCALKDAAVADGAKMMAMRTSLQHQQERVEEKRALIAARQASLAHMNRHASASDAAASSSAKVPSHANPARSAADCILGDERDDAVPSVFILHRGQKYRLNVQMSDSVLSVKKNISSILRIESKPSDMRLVFNAKYLRDDVTLQQVDAKNGSSFMVFFNASHHDAVEDKRQTELIERKLVLLEAKVKTLARQAEHRLLDTVDLPLKKAELHGTVVYLRETLSLVKIYDDRRRVIEERIQAAENTLHHV
ncbi:unnamed protein product [Agarophyton chilense]